MLPTIKTDGREFTVDPETIFWGTGDRERLEELYSGVRKRLVDEIRELRFGRDIIQLYVNPTDRCNAGCPYCYLPQGVKSRGRSMSYIELEKVARKASEFFYSKNFKGSLVFHGSEPLLNRDNIFRLIEEYGDRMHFGLQTNGFLLSQEDVEFIREKEVSLGISLDSPEESTNDFLRGEGHYKKVMEALHWLEGYRGLSVVTTITNRNVYQLSDLVGLLHGKGVGLSLMNPVRGTQKGALEFMPDPLELAEGFIGAVEEAIRLTKAGGRMVIADFANILLGIVAPSARVMMCDISPCGGGRRFFAVSAGGKAYPCGEFIGMEEFRGGNIFTDSIEGIASSENFLKVTGRKVEDIQGCRECLFRNICGAPCPAEIYSNMGTMLSKSYYCEFYKKVARHAFKVIGRGDVERVIRKPALREMYSIGG